SVLGRRGDRSRVRHSRCRQPRCLFGHQQGFPGGAGHRAGVRGDRDPRQSRGRYPERAPRSQGGGRMSTQSLAATKPVLAVRRGLWSSGRRGPRAVLSLGYLALLVVVSVFAAQIAPYSPVEQNVADLLMPPSAAHWLGTDDLGRDVLSRLIWG